jgi:hypothetical protein
LVRELEPAAGLLAFLYSQNQLFEGEGQNDSWARLDAWAVSEGRVAPEDFTSNITELLLGGLLRGQTLGTHEQ